MFDIYKEAVQHSIRPIKWDDSTFILYMFLIFGAICIGLIIEHRNHRTNIKSNLLWFSILFLLLAIPCCFRDTGDDTEVYRYVFLNAYDSNDPEVNMFEPLFLLLNRFLALFVNDEIIGVALISALSFIFIIGFLRKNANRVNVAFSIMGFVMIYYLQMYNLMRIYLATSIVLYYFKYYEERNLFKTLILLTICTFIHYSSAVLFIPFFLSLLYKKNKTLFFVSFIAIAVVLLGAFSYLENYIKLINRYEGNINVNESQSVGIAQFLYHIPLFVILLISHKKRIWDELTDWLMIFTMVSLLFGLVGYIIPIANRINIHFIVIYTLLVPHQLYILKTNRYKYYQPVCLMYILLLFLKLHLYLLTGLATDAIMPYEFAY